MDGWMESIQDELFQKFIPLAVNTTNNNPYWQEVLISEYGQEKYK